MKKRSSLARNRLDRGRRSPSIYNRTETQPVEKTGLNFSLIIFIILLCGLVYIVFFSPLFLVKEVEVNELKFVNGQKVITEVNSYKNNLLNNNTITFSSSGLEKIIDKIDGVEETKVKKNYPNKIIVEIEEKTPVLIWETIGKKYLVDESGTVTGDFEDRFKDFPTVTDTKNLPIEKGKQIAPTSFTKFVKELNAGFNTYTGANIKKIEVPEITSEIKVNSSSSWYALFDTTRTAKGQLVNLSRIITETKSKKKHLQYVDLRIDNRIFYK